jgi:hypothetical protein
VKVGAFKRPPTENLPKRAVNRPLIVPTRVMQPASLTSTNAKRIPRAKNIPKVSNIPTIHSSMSDISAVGIPEGGIPEGGIPEDCILENCILENCIPAHSNPIDRFQAADVHQEFHPTVQMVAHPAKQQKQMLLPKKAELITASI